MKLCSTPFGGKLCSFPDKTLSQNDPKESYFKNFWKIEFCWGFRKSHLLEE